MSRRGVVALWALVVAAHPAAGQTPPAPQRFRVSAGIAAQGSYPLGNRDTLLRRNAPGPATTLAFFTTESRLESAPGFDARVSYGFTRRIAIEVAASYLTPLLAVGVTLDPEHQSPARIEETISQYAVDVSGVVQLPFLNSPHVRPYAFGGAGYLRQLHEARLLLETGATGHAGAGVSYWISGRPDTRRGMGVRGEARYVRRWRGVDFDDAPRGYLSVSALGFIGF